MKHAITLAGLLVLAACVSSGVRVDEENLAAFEKGTTTYSEVITRLGQPTTNALMPDGRRMLMYTWVQARARPQNFIPIVGAFMGGADSRSSSVVIWINAVGKLEGYSASQSQYGIGRGLEAGANPGPIADQPRTVRGGH
jgi:hypothetical protein